MRCRSIFQPLIYLICLVVLSKYQSSSQSLNEAPYSEVNIEDYPYVVYIIVGDDDNFCGGVVVEEHFVVTVASCLLTCREEGTYDPRRGNGTVCPSLDVCNIKVYAQKSISKSSFSDLRVSSRVKHVYYHPDLKFMDYEERCRWKNDIAMIELIEPLKVKHVEVDVPITVDKHNRSKLFYEEYTHCFMVGYGVKHQRYPTDNDTFRSTILKMNEVNVINQQECSDIFNREDFPGSLPVYGICTYNDICSGNYRASICEGDLGNPLVCDGLFSGMLSKVNTTKCIEYGENPPVKDNEELTYQVYTRIDVLSAWIQSVIDGKDKDDD